MSKQKTRTLNIEVNDKQQEVLKYLFDGDTTTVVFGGAWRSGKSFVIAFFALTSIMKHKNIRILVARNFYTDLRNTTIKTFLEVISNYELKNKLEIKQNPFVISSPITGSEIVFLGVDQNDENAFRGLSLTHICIDEASEFPENIIKQLYGRLSYGLTENSLKAKVLLCTNPTKGWLYRSVYLPAKNNELPKHTKFVNATLKDNEIFLPPDYLMTMTAEIIGEDKYELYVQANWDYVVGANDLILSNQIYNCFYRADQPQGDSYLTCDPAAGGGGDNSVVVVWDGWNIIEIISFNIGGTRKLVDVIKELIIKYNIHVNNVIIEVTGIGLGIKEQIMGSVGFIPNATNIEGFDKQIYSTLKDYCYDRCAKKIIDGQITIKDHKYINEISEELTAHKYIYTGGKIKISPKDEVKRRIGRSPDYSDAIAMRLIKELKPRPSFKIEVWDI